MNQTIEERLERDLVAPLLDRVLLTITVAASLTALTAAVTGNPRIALWGFGNALIVYVLLRIARRGYLRTASLIESLVLIVTANYTLTTGYGLLDVSMLMFPGLFLLTSVLLSARWIIVVVVVTDVSVLAVGLAQKWGWLVTPGSNLVEYVDIVDAVILLTTMAAFVQYLVASMRRMIVTAQRAHRKTREILDATSDAIIIHDAQNGKILEVNAPTLQMFACGAEELVGRAASGGNDTASPCQLYLANVTEYIQRAVSDKPQSFEWLAQPKDVGAFWVEVVLRSAVIGEMPCVVAVLRDITARRRLEQRVREAETLRAVGQLAGGVAHDFNNQLMGIFGNAEFLRDAVAQDAQLSDCADSILASGRRAADLTQQLLAFARRGRRQSRPVDMHQLIAEVIALGRRSIDKRIIIEQRLNALHAVANGDPSALQNALLNLLLNARDAMPLGGTVQFSTHNTDIGSAAPRESVHTLLPGQYIEIEVSDTGSGIVPDVIERVFDPFFTTKESGTGMGLAAVKGTVLDHQGLVEVTSQSGKGSVFRLLLPVVNQAVPIEDAPKSQPRVPRGQGRVLVVDDEAIVASVIRRTLETGGYDVDVCSGGLPALERCEANRYDLVLLDVMMPDLDGVEVLRRLRAMRADAPVVLMTGHAEETVQARLREYSDVTVMSKPFLPRELLEEVRKHSAH